MGFRVEQESGQRLAQFGLADAGRAEEQERAVGAVRIGQPRARAPDSVGHDAHGLVLADDALVQRVFHLQQLFALALHHLGDRNAGRARNDFGDLFGADLSPQQLRLLRLLAREFLVGFLQLRLELRQLAVLQFAHLLPVALALGFFHRELDLVDLFLDVLRTDDLRLLGLPDFVEIRVLALELGDFLFDQLEAFFRRRVLFLLDRFALDLELDHPPLEPVHDLRLGVDFHLDARRGFVDQVDRLVGQETIGDVAMRQLGRGDDRRVGDLHAVMDLVALLQAAQDGDGRLDARLVDENLLESAFERGVLLDVLAVLVERSRADAMQFAARQRRLEHVARVDRAFGLAGADHRMQLVDEHDRLALVGGNVLEHGLQPLLEFAAILGAGEQHRHVERKDTLVLERLRHLAVDDSLRETFDDGGLADAGFADQHGVVLGSALQDLDRAADLVVATDYRIELALSRTIGEVDGVFLERLALALGLLRVDATAAADGFDGRLQCFFRQAMLLQQPSRIALVVREGEQEQFAGDELVTAFDGDLVGDVEKIAKLAGNADLAALPLDFGQSRDRLGKRRLERGHVDAGAREQRSRAPILLVEQSRQQVLRLDEAAVVAERHALGIGERLLEFGGQFIYAHAYPSRSFDLRSRWGKFGEISSEFRC